MAQNLNLVLRITGDASGLKAEIVGAKREVEGLGASGASAGQQASGGLGAAAAAAMRLAGSLVAVGGAASGILAVARAGDTANAAIGRLSVATGSLEAAVDVYGRLYDLSLRTGVSVADAAGAFQRFSIAAREIGATNQQALALVETLQQAAIVGGASGQEASAAAQQLAQSLASGVLQGDELRSFLENMPQLAQALARELGVGVGELRKMGADGKLTADVVFPALIRAGVDIRAAFEALPPSMERGFKSLGVAVTQFVSDLDRALGLSRSIAGGLQSAAEAIERARLAAGLGQGAPQARFDANAAADRLAALRAEEARLEAAMAPREIDGVRVAQPSGTRQAQQRRLADLRQQIDAEIRAREEAEARLLEVEREGLNRRLDETAAAEVRGADNRRRQSEQQITELREQLDRRLAIRREAQEREETIARAVEAQAISAEQAAGLRRDSAARARDQLAALNRGADDGQRDVEQALADMRRTRDEGARLTESLRTPLETLNAETERYNALLAAGAISQETFNRALHRAQGQYQLSLPANDAQREAEAMRRTFAELGRMGEQAFDRVGQSITQALAQGQMDFRRLNQVGLAVASELTQAFLRLAIINPIKNAVFGGNATTFGDVTGAIGRWWNGAPSTANVDASLATMTGVPFHTGGIAGREAGGVPRAMPASLFATAPRFHAGRVAPDEVPAILRRDEGVFTPEQMARLGPAGGSYTFAPTIHWQGGSPQDPEALAAMLRQMWQADMQRMAPGIVEASKASLRLDVRRMGADRALAGPA